MKDINHPFNLYDFFGYLFPGITFCSFALSCDFCREHLLSCLSSFKQNEIQLNLLECFLVLLFIGYIAGHVISALSSYLLERRIVEPIFGFPSKNMFFSKSGRKIWVFKKYRHSYSDSFKNEFRNLYTSSFNIEFENPSDIFWLPFEFVAHNCPIAFSRASNFLNLYGFSRNLSMAFFLGGFFIIIPSVSLGHMPSKLMWLFFVFALVTSLFLFNNYMKLLRMFNDEVFRAFYSYMKTRDIVSNK